MSELFSNIRIVTRDEAFLDRIAGLSGQIYTNRDTGSIRVYNGDTQGGAEIAKADFENINSDAQLDLQSKKNRLRFHWDTLTDLETEVDPVTYHGMIAHVHSEGRLYFAHAGEWIPVANLSEAQSIPYEADTEDGLQWVEGTWDFGNNIIKYANAIQLEADLANYDAGVYHGMTMHVHETGALYYAHAGEWRKLITDTAHSDVESAGYVSPLGAAAYSNSYADLNNTPTSITEFGITDGENGQVLSTDGAGTFTFVDLTSGAGTGFNTIISDDGEYTSGSTTDLVIAGGTNIETEVVTDSDTLTVSLQSFSIDFLTDVDTATNPPSSGQVLKWDGAKWAPGTDVAEGGSGLDADTLDGQDGSYYLNYDNFTNTPATLTLDSLSIGNERTATGNGAIEYDDATGEFRYTPPTATGIGALTEVAFSDLTATPTTIAGYGITDAFSGDYADLSNTPSIPSVLTDLGITDGADGEVLTTDGAGNFQFAAVSGGGGDPDQNIFATVSSDSGSTTADTVTDTLTIAGGTDIETSVSGDTVTIDFTGAGGTSQNLFETVSADSGSTTADTSTDTLTVSGGTDISTTVSGDTVTISYTGSGGGAANFNELTDVGSASIDVNDIFEAAIVTLRVDNSGASAYTFDSHYAGDNPTIYALSGTTIAFDLSLIGGHPFEIQDSGGAAISAGLVHVSATGTVSTGAAAQGFDSGTLYWRIQESLSGNYQYQCQFHSGMNGTITIKRLSAI